MNNDFGLSLKAAFKREEIKEYTKKVMNEFEEFIKKYNIDITDKENPTVFLYYEGEKIKNKLYDKSYKTVKELTKAEGKLDLIKKYIELINKKEI